MLLAIMRSQFVGPNSTPIVSLKEVRGGPKFNLNSGETTRCDVKVLGWMNMTTMTLTLPRNIDYVMYLVTQTETVP